jgi:hypothetical protein
MNLEYEPPPTIPHIPVMDNWQQITWNVELVINFIQNIVFVLFIAITILTASITEDVESSGGSRSSTRLVQQMSGEYIFAI